MKNLPNRWKVVELKNLFDIKKGKKVNIADDSSNNGIPYIGIGNLRGVPISQYTFDNNGLLCEKDDILLVWDGANCGTVGYGLSGFVGSTIARLRLVDSSSDKDYLFRFLKSKFEYFNSNTTGAIIPHLDKKNVLSLEIPLPPLPTQKRIAAVLEKAEKLREWRKEADRLTDAFLKNTFLGMFGDPVGNPKGWEHKKLMELGNWQSGGTPSRSNGDYFKGDIPWYTAGELNSLFVYDSIEKITQDAIKESSAKLISPNNLLLGMYDTAALKSSITTVECACNQAIVFSKLEYGLANIFYLFYVIHVARKHYMRQQRGVRQKNLNLSMIRNLEVPVPPIELQNKFASIVQQVEQIREHQTQSRQHIENFFNVLMQRAFRGELEVK